MNISLSTTVKIILAEVVTAIADTQKSSFSWQLNIFSNVILAYRKLTSYTGPYLLPDLRNICTSVVDIYTPACNTALWILNSNAKEVKRNLIYALLLYILPDDYNCLTTVVQNAIDKFSNAQKNEKFEDAFCNHIIRVTPSMRF